MNCINAPGLIDAAISIGRISKTERVQLEKIAAEIESEKRGSREAALKSSDASLLDRLGTDLLKNAVVAKTMEETTALANWGSALTELARVVRERLEK